MGIYTRTVRPAYNRAVAAWLRGLPESRKQALTVQYMRAYNNYARTKSGPGWRQLTYTSAKEGILSGVREKRRDQ